MYVTALSLEASLAYFLYLVSELTARKLKELLLKTFIL